MYLKTVFAILAFILRSRSQVSECHTDSIFQPAEGPVFDITFTWLGTLQYIHSMGAILQCVCLSDRRWRNELMELLSTLTEVQSAKYRSAVKKGDPHYFRVPRVVLVTRQYVLCTALDAADVPDGYALGNIVLGEYERDEVECKLTIDQLASGKSCDPAVLVMPIVDAIVHPEFRRDGIEHTIALLKMITEIKSKYVLPVCLPVANMLRRKFVYELYNLDFPDVAPRDYANEDKELTKLTVKPMEQCITVGKSYNRSQQYAKGCMICTTGCSLHSGSPSVVHERVGAWVLVAIAQGNFECPDPLRSYSRSLAHHVLIFPYVPWIRSITYGADGTVSKNDPFGFANVRAKMGGRLELENMGWVGHWWMGSPRCHDRGEAAERLFRFYHEIFFIKPAGETYVTYYLEVVAAHGVRIVCVKVAMPFQLSQPMVWNSESEDIYLKIPTIRLVYPYKIQVECWGINRTTAEHVEYDDPEYPDYQDYDATTKK